MTVTFGQTVIHPVAMTATVLGGVLMLFLERRRAVCVLFVTAIFIPIQQRLVIAGIDLLMVRILVLFGWTRILLFSEARTVRLNPIDKAMIAWAIVRVIFFTLQIRSAGAFVNRLGNTFDALGIYFLVRILLQDFRDVQVFNRLILWLTVFLAVAMSVEWLTARNVFSVFGGVPEITMVREGKFRCQGAFGHPINAGTFAAASLPLFLSFWWEKDGGQKLAVLGVLVATIVTLTTSSSGPVLTYAASVFTFGAWVLRERMRMVRWAIVGTLVTLHLVMKGPVWSLLNKVRVFSASTGYHRFYLVDQFIRRFRQWWLFGTRTETWGGHSFDVSNLFVRQGVDGGLATLSLFIVILVRCFRGVGETLKRAAGNREAEIFIWSLGASMAAHVFSFFGASYWDQIVVLWYSLLAVISAVSVLPAEAFRAVREPLPQEATREAYA